MEEVNKKAYTIKEILVDVHSILGDINVPASKINEIGVPIAKCMDGIHLCIEAIEKQENAKENDIEVSDLEPVDKLPEDAELIQLN